MLYIHRRRRFLTAQDLLEVRALRLAHFRRYTVVKEWLLHLQRLAQACVQLLAVLAGADLLLDSIDLEDRLEGAVLAEDFPADLAVVAAEEETELCVALVAGLSLLVGDPVWLRCRT